MAQRQSAAIPYRRNAANELEVLLVTSRTKGRWVLPKGTVRRMLPSAAAAREAFEEAGVLGVISMKSIGAYLQMKSDPSGEPLELSVSAFPLYVNTLLATWPEQAFRQRQWMRIQDAIKAVEHAELRSILRAFGEQYEKGDPD